METGLLISFEHGVVVYGVISVSHQFGGNCVIQREAANVHDLGRGGEVKIGMSTGFQEDEANEITSRTEPPGFIHS